MPEPFGRHLSSRIAGPAGCRESDTLRPFRRRIPDLSEPNEGGCPIEIALGSDGTNTVRNHRNQLEKALP